MPLTERDTNFSGRMSRASNMPTGSRGLQKGKPAKPDHFPNAPGVMGMLRTSTELGDIGTLTFDSSHLPSVPRAPQPHRRSGAASRFSTGSAHSQTSKRASNHHAQPSGSSSARCSLTGDINVPQYLPHTLSPTVMSLQGSSPLIPHARLSRDGRSFYRSLSLGGNEDHRAFFKSKLARRPLQSLVSSATDRPWNVDKNYPWADDMPAINISLPVPTHLRDAFQPRASSLRLRLSGSSDGSQSDYGVHDESTVSPIMSESTSSNDPFKHTRKASKQHSWVYLA